MTGRNYLKTPIPPPPKKNKPKNDGIPHASVGVHSNLFSIFNPSKGKVLQLRKLL